MKLEKEGDRSRTLIILLYFLIAFSLLFSFFLYTSIPIIKRAPAPPSFHEFYGIAKCDNNNNVYDIYGVTLTVTVSNGTSSNTFNSNIQDGAYSIVVSGNQAGDSVVFLIGGNQVDTDIYNPFLITNKNLTQPSGQAGCPQTPYSGGGGSGGGGGGGVSTNGGGGSIKPKISQIQSSFSGGGSAIITWTTDIDSDSQVDFGPSNNLGLTRSVILLTKTHAIEIENLLAETLYYYKVSSKSSLGVREYSNIFTFSTPKLSSQCSDTFDNDGDGLFDLEDPGCVDSTDNSEVDTQIPAGLKLFTAKNTILQIGLLAILVLIIITLAFVTYSSWALFKRDKK